MANIIPVPKVSRPSDLNDFRPISLTSTFSKVFEKLLLRFLLPYYTPGAYQFGFTHRRSCNSCATSVLSRTISYLENPKCSKVCAVFFDKKKAFDSVVHNILLSKLFYDFNVHPALVALLRSFLHNRTQRVTIGSSSSPECKVVSGVPQGSVLGPQLFLFFINQLSSLSFSKFTELFLFADDSVLMKPIFRADDYDSLQTDVDLVYDWCTGNSIALNSTKCRVMQMSYSNRPTVMPALSLGAVALERVDEYRYLGLIIQSNPSSWTSHCRWVLKRARKVFYAFRIYYGKNSPNSTMLTIYRTAVRSILDYCCELVLPNSYFSNQFERLQKLALRSYLHAFDISYELTLWKCNVERLCSRRAASAIVSLVKYFMCAHFTLPGFFVFPSELCLRRGGRGGVGRDLVLVRNFPGDNLPKQFSTFSPSFKKSFYFRASHNYNSLRRHADLDMYSFRDLRRILSLYAFDSVTGLLIV